MGKMPPTPITTPSSMQLLSVLFVLGGGQKLEVWIHSTFTHYIREFLKISGWKIIDTQVWLYIISLKSKQTW